MGGTISTLPWIALLACAPFGCTKTFPPAPTPPPLVPRHDHATPPPAGHGRLIVDVVEGPTPVQNIRLDAKPFTNHKGRTMYRLGEAPQLICNASPCIVDVLAPGNIVLGFPVVGSNATEVELVHVGLEPSVYRRSLSIYNDNTGSLRVLGIIAASVGGAAILTGIPLLTVGLSDDRNGLTTAGSITLGGGALLLWFGIWAMRKDAPWYRPGSSNHFPVGQAQ